MIPVAHAAPVLRQPLTGVSFAFFASFFFFAFTARSREAG